jgi:hypothetical protein
MSPTLCRFAIEHQAESLGIVLANQDHGSLEKDPATGQ